MLEVGPYPTGQVWGRGAWHVREAATEGIFGVAFGDHRLVVIAGRPIGEILEQEQLLDLRERRIIGGVNVPLKISALDQHLASRLVEGKAVVGDGAVAVAVKGA